MGKKSQPKNEWYQIDPKWIKGSLILTWYLSEPSRCSLLAIPQTSFLVWTFIAVSYSKLALVPPWHPHNIWKGYMYHLCLGLCFLTKEMVSYNSWPSTLQIIFIFSFQYQTDTQCRQIPPLHFAMNAQRNDRRGTEEHEAGP